MFRIIQYTLATVLGAVSLIFNINVEWTNSVCLVLILVLGIPHGGVDHLIHISSSTDRHLFKYILKYLMIAGGYILWWLIDPSKALFIFIVLSAYHFGQEFVADMGLKTQKMILNLIWGSLILISPMLYSYSEIAIYLQIIIPNLTNTIHPVLTYLLPSFSLFIALLSIVWLTKSGRISRLDALKMLQFTFLIVMCHLVLTFVHAFTIYFVLFHSLNAFKHQFMWLKDQKENYSTAKFIKDLIGFSLLAILGIIILLWFLNPKGQSTLITYFFVLTSIITLPHAITLDQFYRFRSKAKLNRLIN